MFFLETFAGSASLLTSPTIWVFIFIGSMWGVFVGAMPGVGSSAGFALLLPLTFIIEPVNSVAMLLAVSVGNAYGNSLPAIVLGIPGSPATIMTVLDGNALYKQGKGDIALGAGEGFEEEQGLFSDQTPMVARRRSITPAGRRTPRTVWKRR